MRALSIAPVAYAIGVLVYQGAGGSWSGWRFGVAHGLMMLVLLVLLVRSLRHINRNDALSRSEKMTWSVLAWVFGVVTLPVYWFTIAPRGARSEPRDTPTR